VELSAALTSRLRAAEQALIRLELAGEMDLLVTLAVYPLHERRRIRSQIELPPL
jgi:hypothetical protein